MTDNLQLDIFGNMVPVEEAKTGKPAETIQSRYRKMYGYDEAHRCEECEHLVTVAEEPVHYKCELIGLAASEATDIRLSDISCKRFQQKTQKEEEPYEGPF